MSNFIPFDQRRLIFWLLIAVVGLILFTLTTVGAPLLTEAAPAGIISYEFAGDITSAQRILDSWDAGARQRAAFIQGLDFLFIPVYVTIIGLGCGMAADTVLRKSWPLPSLGALLAWAVLFAGLLDILENIALVLMLFDKVANPWPQIAFWCAAPKFVLIILGICYILYAALAYLLGKVSKK